MLDRVRQEIVALAQTVVVKVGTNVLTGADGRSIPRGSQALADQMQRIRPAGRKVALVSSGAIGAGVGRLGLGKRPTDLRHLQACAAVGQSFLMRAYQECFGRHGIHAAQILLTAGDFDNRARYLNARNTILTLFEWGVSADHQRKRHRQRGRDPIRRQRSPGRHGDEPAAGAAADSADSGGRLYRGDPTTDPAAN